MAVSGVALFLDRDGTINTEVDFLRHPDEVVLIPRAAQAIREANLMGLRVVVVTNQSGIARGFLTESDLARVHRRLVRLLAKEGARVDGFEFCPHHPEYGLPPYRLACDCRKPHPGMLKNAARKYGLDLGRSYMIGDRLADLQAGRSAGCTSLLVLTGYGATAREECERLTPAPLIAADLFEAWQLIKSRLATISTISNAKERYSR